MIEEEMYCTYEIYSLDINKLFGSYTDNNAEVHKDEIPLKDIDYYINEHKEMIQYLQKCRDYIQDAANELQKRVRKTED